MTAETMVSTFAPCQCAALLVVVLGVGFATNVSAQGSVPLPNVVRGTGDRCVEPTEVMRRDHMEFLLHQRDETMYRGIRTKRHSLKECVSCHVSRDSSGRAIPINAQGEFCAACHEYAAVTIDCFECHAQTPDDGEPSSAASKVSGGTPEAGISPEELRTFVARWLGGESGRRAQRER